MTEHLEKLAVDIHWQNKELTYHYISIHIQCIHDSYPASRVGAYKNDSLNETNTLVYVTW